MKLLGKGTYGKTYLVEDPKTKERFALKKITINDKIELKENQEEYNLILKLTKEFPELKIINIYGIEIKKLYGHVCINGSGKMRLGKRNHESFRAWFIL